MQTHLEYAKKNRFFDPWEELNNIERENQKKIKLDEFIKFASKLPYYKDKLSCVKIDDNDPLRDVPVLSSEEFKQLLPPFSDTLISQDHSCYNIYQSGGTTGFPKTSLFSYQEMDLLQKIYARGLYACNLQEKDNVANVFATGSLYMTFNHAHDMLQRYGCRNFGFGHAVDPDFFKIVCQKFKINTLLGVGSTIMNLLNSISNNKLECYQFDKIYYGGEHIYEADKKKLNEKFSIKTILSPGYGSVETWYIGYQCSQSSSGTFHAYDDQCYIEIINPETGKLCLPGEIGIIHVTPFVRRLTPTVRYVVGDKAYWTNTTCKCGRTTPLFKLLGRGSNVIRIGFDTIDYQQIVELYIENNEIGLIQIERKRFDSKDQLIIRLESNNQTEDFKKELLNKFIESRSVLKNDLQKDIIHSPTINFINVGQMPLNSRTGKLIKVIDFEDIDNTNS